MTNHATSYLLYFKTSSYHAQDLHDRDAWSCAGSIFLPHLNSNQYGRNSIKVSSILKWNHLSQVLKKNALFILKLTEKTSTNHILNSNSPYDAILKVFSIFPFFVFLWSSLHSFSNFDWYSFTLRLSYSLSVLL